MSGHQLIVGGTLWIIVYRVRADVVEIIRVLRGVIVAAATVLRQQNAHARGARRRVRSDWMAVERERGISPEIAAESPKAIFAKLREEVEMAKGLCPPLDPRAYYGGDLILVFCCRSANLNFIFYFM